MIVLVNPITKQPTAFSPVNSEQRNLIFDGPYQNVAEVSEEWVAAERARLRVLEGAVSDQMFDPKTHAELLPEWKQWAAEHNVRVPPNVLHNYCPNTEGTRTDAAVATERARCLAIAADVLQRGPGFPASKEFADGYSLAAQEIAAEIQRGGK